MMSYAVSEACIHFSGNAAIELSRWVAVIPSLLARALSGSIALHFKSKPEASHSFVVLPLPDL